MLGMTWLLYATTIWVIGIVLLAVAALILFDK